jgi:hypothetical protein
MFSGIAVTTIHSTGINWGQALATWIPIVITVIGALVALIRGIKKWNKNRDERVELIADRLIKGFASTLSVKFDKIDSHLEKQDERLDRIDRNTGTNST